MCLKVSGVCLSASLVQVTVVIFHLRCFPSKDTTNVLEISTTVEISTCWASVVGGSFFRCCPLGGHKRTEDETGFSPKISDLGGHVGTSGHLVADGRYD